MMNAAAVEILVFNGELFLTYFIKNKARLINKLPNREHPTYDRGLP